MSVCPASCDVSPSDKRNIIFNDVGTLLPLMRPKHTGFILDHCEYDGLASEASSSSEKKERLIEPLIL